MNKHIFFLIMVVITLTIPPKTLSMMEMEVDDEPSTHCYSKLMPFYYKITTHALEASPLDGFTIHGLHPLLMTNRLEYLTSKAPPEMRKLSTTEMDEQHKEPEADYLAALGQHKHHITVKDLSSIVFPGEKHEIAIAKLIIILLDYEANLSEKKETSDKLAKKTGIDDSFDTMEDDFVSKLPGSTHASFHHYKPSQPESADTQ